MDDKLIYGYGGILSFSLPSELNSGSVSIFYMTDNIKSVLIAIPLCSGFYKDLINTIYCTSFVNILIIMPSIDQNMISDLIMSVKMASFLKGIDHIRWANPDNIQWDSDVMCITHIDSRTLFINHVCESKFDTELMIVFSSKPHVTKINSNVYDITLWTGSKTIYFMQYPGFSNLYQLSNQNNFDELHLPWKPLWGGLSGIEIVDDLCSGNKIFIEKLKDRYSLSNEELQMLTYNNLENYMFNEIGKPNLNTICSKAIYAIKEKLRFHSFTSRVLYNTMRYKFNLQKVDLIEEVM